MIVHLTIKNVIDIYEFLNRVGDRFEDFFITEIKLRKFLYNNLKLIKKIVKKYECYGYFDIDLQGVIFIYREKGYRPYIKILTKNKRITEKLLGYLFLKNESKELFIKLKKENPIINCLNNNFIKIGDRGRELLFRKIEGVIKWIQL